MEIAKFLDEKWIEFSQPPLALHITAQQSEQASSFSTSALPLKVPKLAQSWPTLISMMINENDKCKETLKANIIKAVNNRLQVWHFLNLPGLCPGLLAGQKCQQISWKHTLVMQTSLVVSACKYSWSMRQSWSAIAAALRSSYCITTSLVRVWQTRA